MAQRLNETVVPLMERRMGGATWNWKQVCGRQRSTFRCACLLSLFVPSLCPLRGFLTSCFHVQSTQRVPFSFSSHVPRCTRPRRGCSRRGARARCRPAQTCSCRRGVWWVSRCPPFCFRSLSFSFWFSLSLSASSSSFSPSPLTTPQITCLQMAGVGRLVSASDDHTLRVWDLHTQKVTQDSKDIKEHSVL